MITNSTPQKFIAVSNGIRIMSVLAHSEQDARDEIVRQLDRPGRRDALAHWQLFGSKIVGDVTIVGICSILDELGLWELDFKACSGVVMAWVRDNDAHYYARPHDKFFEWEAVQEAQELGKSLVVVEDLS